MGVAIAASKLRVRGPLVRVPDSSTALTASTSSSPVKPVTNEAMYSGPPMPCRIWLTPRPAGPWKPARALAIRLRSGAFGRLDGAK